MLIMAVSPMVKSAKILKIIHPSQCLSTIDKNIHKKAKGV